MKKYFTITLILIFFCFLWVHLFSAWVSARESSIPRVLVLHSYHRSLSWVISIEKGIAAKFKENKSTAVFRFEYMDTKRINRPDYLRSLFELYKIKFKNIRFDVVICSDNNALDFLLTYHQRLFPDTPIVFCGINNFKEGLLSNHTLFTGVVEAVDFRSTLDIALDLHPKTRQIIFYGDDSATYHHNKSLLDDLIPEYENRLAFVYKSPFNVEQILNNIQSLESDSLILLGTTVRTSSGELLSFEDSVKQMEAVSRVPIYGCWDFFMGHGLVGGMMTCGVSQGKEAADIALRILGGQTPADIPVIRKSPNQYMFDNDQLKKFNIDPARLPKGSVIINQQVSFYEKNRILILTTLVTIGIFSFFILLLSLNIRKRIRSEQALIKSEKQFRDLFNSITDLIFTQDMEGRFTSANPAMKRLFGYDNDAFIGRSSADFMAPELQDGFKTRYLEKVINDGYHEGIASYFKKNGEKIYLEYQSFLVTPENGKSYISGIGRDVTEKVRAKEKLERLQDQVIQSQKIESIGTLAGGIAHDFNNILFPIMGHTEMLLEDIPPDSPFRSSLDRIYSGALRARDLVKQILTFSRQEKSESIEMRIQPIVKEVLKLIRSTIPVTIDIREDIREDCGMIKAKPTQIHQIVMNMATNAFHAMEDSDGEMTISLKRIKLSKHDVIEPDMDPGDYACLTISDTGTGMSKDVVKKVFDPFFTTKELGKGTGMGLSVVHGIVKNLRGSIQVYSEPGKGTRFMVYLPVADPTPGKQPERIQKVYRTGTENILLVDDEDEIVKMEKQMLEKLGYQVTSRTSSLEALEMFRSAPAKFDLVITDMAMPNMAGDRLVAKLIQIRPDIPIILCTGFSETLTPKKMQALGIKGCLLKPVMMRDLSQHIRNILDNTDNGLESVWRKDKPNGE